MFRALNDSFNEETAAQTSEATNVPEKITPEAAESEAFSEFRRALDLMMAQKNEEALHSLKQLLKFPIFTPTLPSTTLSVALTGLLHSIWKNLSELYSTLGFHRNACGSLLNAVKYASSETAYMWETIGQEAIKSEEFLTARTAFQEAEKLDHNSWGAREGLIAIYYIHGDYSSCLYQIKEALKRDSLNEKVKAVRHLIYSRNPWLLEFHPCDTFSIETIRPTIIAEADMKLQALEEKLTAQMAKNKSGGDVDKVYKPEELPSVVTWENVLDAINKLLDRMSQERKIRDARVDLSGWLSLIEPDVRTEVDDVMESLLDNVVMSNDDNSSQLELEKEAAGSDDGFRLVLEESSNDSQSRMSSSSNYSKNQNKSGTNKKSGGSSNGSSSAAASAADNSDVYKRRSSRLVPGYIIEDEYFNLSAASPSSNSTSTTSTSASLLASSMPPFVASTAAANDSSLSLSERIRQFLPKRMLRKSSASAENSEQNKNKSTVGTSAEGGGTQGPTSCSSTCSKHEDLSDTWKDMYGFVAQLNGLDRVDIILETVSAAYSIAKNKAVSEGFQKSFLALYHRWRAMMQHRPWTPPNPHALDGITVRDRHLYPWYHLMAAEYSTNIFLRKAAANHQDGEGSQDDSSNSRSSNAEFSELMSRSQQTELLCGVTFRHELFQTERDWVEYIIRSSWLRYIIHSSCCRRPSAAAAAAAAESPNPTGIHSRPRSILLFIREVFTLALGSADESLVDFEAVPSLASVDDAPFVSLELVNRRLTELEKSRLLTEVEGIYQAGDYEKVSSLLTDELERKQKMQGFFTIDSLLQINLLTKSLFRLGKIEETIKFLKIGFDLVMDEICKSENENEKGEWTRKLEELAETLNGVCAIDAEEACQHLDNSTTRPLIQLLLRQSTSPKKSKAQDKENLGEEAKEIMPWLLLYTMSKTIEDGMMSETYLKGWFRHIDPQTVMLSNRSLMLLKMGHEELGGSRRCTVRKGRLLLVLANEIIAALRHPLFVENPKLMPSGCSDDMLNTAEQCFFCLFAYPTKKKRHLEDHYAGNVELEWSHVSMLFDFVRPESEPEFDKRRTDTVSSETVNLLHRIVKLIPVMNRPNPLLPRLESHLTEKSKETPANLAIADDMVLTGIYHLLGDYYQKSGYFQQATESYGLDICVSGGRFDSWAGLALSYLGIVQDKLNRLELTFEEKDVKDLETFVLLSEGSFLKALSIHPDYTVLQIEYGSLCYQYHSFRSRMYAQLLPKQRITPRRVLESAKKSRDLYLNRAYKNYSEADTEEEKWIKHYFLGKIAEKKKRTHGKVFGEYHRSLYLLHHDGAKYPEKVRYQGSKNHAMEAIEVYFRAHAYALKCIERDEINDWYVVYDYMRLFRSCPLTKSEYDDMSLEQRRKWDDPPESFHFRHRQSSVASENEAEKGSIEMATLTEMVDTVCMKEDVIRWGLDAMKLVIRRFYNHYKAYKRLASAYAYIPNIKDLKRAETVMISSNATASTVGISQSLFVQKKASNLFEGIYRIPLEDVDRNGSFETHCYKSVDLLTKILQANMNVRQLLQIFSQLLRMPQLDKTKQYLAHVHRTYLLNRIPHLLLPIYKRKIDLAPEDKVELNEIGCEMFQNKKMFEDCSESIVITKHWNALLTKIYKKQVKNESGVAACSADESWDAVSNYFNGLLRRFDVGKNPSPKKLKRPAKQQQQQQSSPAVSISMVQQQQPPPKQIRLSINDQTNQSTTPRAPSQQQQQSADAASRLMISSSRKASVTPTPQQQQPSQQSLVKKGNLVEDFQNMMKKKNANIPLTPSERIYDEGIEKFRLLIVTKGISEPDANSLVKTIQSYPKTMSCEILISFLTHRQDFYKQKATETTNFMPPKKVQKPSASNANAMPKTVQKPSASNTNAMPSKKVQKPPTEAANNIIPRKVQKTTESSAKNFMHAKTTATTTFPASKPSADTFCMASHNHNVSVVGHQQQTQQLQNKPPAGRPTNLSSARAAGADRIDHRGIYEAAANIMYKLTGSSTPTFETKQAQAPSSASSTSAASKPTSFSTSASPRDGSISGGGSSSVSGGNINSQHGHGEGSHRS